jgi:hypothetical protein
MDTGGCLTFSESRLMHISGGSNFISLDCSQPLRWSDVTQGQRLMQTTLRHSSVQMMRVCEIGRGHSQDSHGLHQLIS